jgi:hypothetical protein
MVGFGAGLGVPSWRPAFGWIWGGLAEAGWGRVDFGVPCEPTSTGRVRAGVPCEGGFTGHPGGGSRRKGTLGVGCDLASYYPVHRCRLYIYTDLYVSLTEKCLRWGLLSVCLIEASGAFFCLFLNLKEDAPRVGS